MVDWFEIISENYMIDGGRPLAILDQILEQYKVVQHGVSLYFGSAQPLNREHLTAAEGAGAAHQNAVAERPLVLGQRGWALYPRSASAALHLGGGEGGREKHSPRAGLSGSSRWRWKT